MKEGIIMENTNKCPCCSNHCDRNNLQCGKGEAYFNGEAVPSSEHGHGRHEGKHHSHHGGKHHGHHRPEYPAGSLADLMSKCGHRLVHSGDESMFAVLTEEEQVSLKNLLTKLISK